MFSVLEDIFNLNISHVKQICKHEIKIEKKKNETLTLFRSTVCDWDHFELRYCDDLDSSTLLIQTFCIMAKAGIG